MGKLSSPANLLELLGDNLPDFARARLMASAMASKAGLPLNMDAWDGYPAARERVFKGALEADANLLVLAGDTHNAWSFDLAQDGAKVGVEFGVCSVSSPGPDPATNALVCPLVIERIRFNPATDANGDPVPAQYGWRQDFGSR